MEKLDNAISIVICTRNRAATLARCLDHITGLDHSSSRHWELIVIDNRSDDATRSEVDRRMNRLPLRYVYEARVGLSHARNRGIAEARFPIIAFTDDDCLIAPDWADSILRAFAQDPALAIVGGRAELANHEDALIGVRVHRESAAIITPTQILELMIGCNMAFCASVFESIGNFDPSLGAGTRVGAAEDIDLIYRALRKKMKIAYSPQIRVMHAHGRNTRAAREDAMHGYLRGRGAFYCKFICRGDREILKLAYWEVRSLAAERMRKRSKENFLRSLAAGAALKLFSRP